MSAISLLSVETITWANNPEDLAFSIAQAIIGLPQNIFMFLRGIRLLPDLAGITAILISAIYLVKQTQRNPAEHQSSLETWAT